MNRNLQIIYDIQVLTSDCIVSGKKKLYLIAKMPENLDEAEVVGCSQAYSTPEYEFLRKHKIFPDKQIASIIKSRQNYQYKLGKNKKIANNYVEYIIYEKQVYNVILSIEKRRRENYSTLKAILINRISSLHKEAILASPEETRIWNAYLKFCKKHLISEVFVLYDQITEKQGDNPLVWSNAALWYYEQGNNMEKVKSIFFRGLQRHPEDEKLYLVFFKILLLETSNQAKDHKEASLERVIAVYNTAKKKICNVAFLFKLLNECDKDTFVEFSKPLQKLIINDMMELYPREESVWDLLAQRELRGCSMSEFLDENIIEPLLEEKMVSDQKDDTNDEKKDDKKDDKETDKSGNQKPTLKRRIEMAFSVYQAAVNTLKTPEMWSLFINAMMELNTDLSTQQVLKRKKLAIAFRGAHENNCMSAEHYYAYINLLIESKTNREYIVSIMTEATEQHNTLKLWEQYLTFYVMEDNSKKCYEVFRMCCDKYGQKCYPVWKLLLQYYQTHYDDELPMMQTVFKEACKVKDPQFFNFRVQYLEWILINNDLAHTRRTYNTMLALTPPSLEVHQKMIQLETQALKPDIQKMRECYENAITNFGKTRCDVWIDFIKFERAHQPKRMGILCDRAKQTLEPKYVDNFLTEFCLLNIHDDPNKDVNPTENPKRKK